MSVWHAHFRVSGKVQGVVFRKYTQMKAVELGLVGWCRNSADGQSVEGVVQGPQQEVEKMLDWIGTQGSPKCRIEKVEIFAKKSIQNIQFSNFEILK
jgi:acylphosphatase